MHSKITKCDLGRRAILLSRRPMRRETRLRYPLKAARCQLLHHIQIDQNLARTGAVFGANDAAVFKHFHQASRAVVADT